MPARKRRPSLGHHDWAETLQTVLRVAFRAGRITRREQWACNKAIQWEEFRPIRIDLWGHPDPAVWPAPVLATLASLGLAVPPDPTLPIACPLAVRPARPELGRAPSATSSGAALDERISPIPLSRLRSVT